jgi:MFS transporter, FSR family, fosmidomycin resistance protein
MRRPGRGRGAGALLRLLRGLLADRFGIDLVFRLCAYLPLLGLLTAFLPDLRRPADGR